MLKRFSNKRALLQETWNPGKALPRCPPAMAPPAMAPPATGRCSVEDAPGVALGTRMPALTAQLGTQSRCFHPHKVFYCKGENGAPSCTSKGITV